MATIGWNVSIIKDRAREMGINLTDSQASDILNKTFVQSMYGADPNKVISILQSMKSGGGGTGQSSFSFQPPSSTQTDWTSVYQNILTQLRNTWQSPDVSGLTNLASQINPEEMKQKKLELIPLVENVYEKLAERLAKRYETEKKRVETEKQFEQGKQAQMAAAAGFSPSEGFDAALIRNVGKAYNQKIEDLVTQEGLDQEKLTAEKLKDIKQIQAEAEDAALKGYSLLADINYKIAGIKQQQDSLLAQAARDILNAKTEEEKLNWQKYYQNALIELQNKELDLTADKIKKELELQEKELGIKEKALLSKEGEDELSQLVKYSGYLMDKFNAVGVSPDKAYTQAKKYLEQFDRNKDMMLSRDEYSGALRLLQDYLKDPALARAVLAETFDAYGYKKWRW